MRKLLCCSDALKSKRILLVDDEQELLELTKLQLEHYGLKCRTAPSAHQALEILGTEMMDLIVSDVRMPDIDGFEFLKILHEKHPQIPVVLLSGYSDVSFAEAAPFGAKALIQKPVQLSKLFQVLESTIAI